MKELQFEDLGTMRYKPCWEYQEEIFKTIIQRKIDSGIDSSLRRMESCMNPFVLNNLK